MVRYFSTLILCDFNGKITSRPGVAPAGRQPWPLEVYLHTVISIGITWYKGIPTVYIMKGKILDKEDLKSPPLQ